MADRHYLLLGDIAKSMGKTLESTAALLSEYGGQRFRPVANQLVPREAVFKVFTARGETGIGRVLTAPKRRVRIVFPEKPARRGG